MQSAQYLAVIERALAGGGYAPVPEAGMPGVPVVGHRADFRMSWMATKLHLFVTAVPVTVATGADLSRFAHDSLEMAKRVKGGARGFQSGVAAIPVMVADHAHPDAIEFARTQRVANFAAFAWPVLVDLGYGVVTSLQRNPKVGAIYNGWMRQQIAAVAPTPQG